MIAAAAGIYAIVHRATGRAYVGRSVNMRRRTADHVYQLVNGTHANSRLQRAWNRYGKDAFDVVALKVVALPEGITTPAAESFMRPIEEFWIAVRGDFNLSESGHGGSSVWAKPEVNTRRLAAIAENAARPDWQAKQRQANGRKGMPVCARRDGVAWSFNNGAACGRALGYKNLGAKSSVATALRTGTALRGWTISRGACGAPLWDGSPLDISAPVRWVRSKRRPPTCAPGARKARLSRSVAQRLWREGARGEAMKAAVSAANSRAIVAVRGDTVLTFKSRAECGKAIGASPSAMWAVLTGKRPNVHGWELRNAAESRAAA